MDKEKEPNPSGTQFVLSSFAEARRRIARMKRESNFRDSDEIWETYCDIEQSIEVSKYVFKLHNGLGKYRKLSVMSKSDPDNLSISALASIFDKVDSLVASADKAVKEGRGEEAIELSRSARDQLKILLLGQAKSEQIEMRRKKSSMTDK